VAQQVPGVFLLQLDHPGFKVSQSFVVFWSSIPMREAVPVVQPPGNVQIDIGIDTMLLKLVDQVVEPIEHFWVDGGEISTFPPDMSAIHVVEADAVDAQTGQTGGQTLGLLPARKTRLKTKVGGPETDRPGLGYQTGIVPLPLDPHKAVFTGRPMKPATQIR
jgi:hypothetical protein